jgi:hypothetical protein
MPNEKQPFYISTPPLTIVPVLHYTMELAAEVRRAFLETKPECVAVELPEPMQEVFTHAASRLPDISVVISDGAEKIIHMVEPCDASFEALRSALDAKVPCYAIDLDVLAYPEMKGLMPDPYSINRIGLQKYYEAYKASCPPSTPQDLERELYMAKRLKELSFSYENIFVVMGMHHVEGVLKHFHDTSFPQFKHAKRTETTLATLTEESCREVMAEYGYISTQYEEWRADARSEDVPDRQKLILSLLKAAKAPYEESSRMEFPNYVLSLIMKFSRNYSYLKGHLLPDLYELLSACKGCLDHTYAYEVWKIATEYPHLRNIDSLPELKLTIAEIWGKSKQIYFHRKLPTKKGYFSERLRKDRAKERHFNISSFGICSHPPEDTAIEGFGRFLKKKALDLASVEGARTIVFSTSMEDGLDVKETIRHFTEKKLYVKTKGKPPGGIGSLVVIFDEDEREKAEDKENYPWRLSWLGEHEQESDMAFYATPMGGDIVGPGIARCEYGGFLMSYPPRRLFDVWTDPDYQEYQHKSEVLLAAAIDYAVKPVVVYVGPKPPRPFFKQYAQRFGKKVLFIPLSQFSQLAMKKLKTFHVLDSHETRNIADEYI